MKKLLTLLLMLGFGLYAQNTLTISNYTVSASSPNPGYLNLNSPTNATSPYSSNDLVTIKVDDPTQDAQLSTYILQGLGNTYSADDDLIIDGNGIDEIIFNYDIVESSSGRTIVVTNAGKVHFNTGVFTSTGSNGPINLIIGNDNISIGVATLEFDKEPSLNGGVYTISVGTIKDDIGVEFPAIDHDTYSKVKFNTWDASSSATPSFQTYVPTAGDKMICSPTDNGFTNVSAKDGSGTSVTVTKGNLYTYDAQNASWATSPSSDTLNKPGKGFFGFVGSGTNTTGTFLASALSYVTVVGDPNESIIQRLGYSSSVATGGSGGGWNLIGNPYPAPLDWSTVTKTGINDAIYMWNPSSNKYNYYVPGSTPSGNYVGTDISAYIPPMQSFWVEVTNTNGASISTTCGANTITKQAPSVYKTTPDNLIVSMTLNSDSVEVDALWIKNVAGTTPSFEGAEDAWKYINPYGPNIYTTDSLGEGIAINSVDLSTQQFLPLTIAPKKTGSYRFMVEEVINNPQAYQVYLLDLDANQSFNLTSASASISLDSGIVYDDSYALFITSTSTVGISENQTELLEWDAVVTRDGIKVEIEADDVQYQLLDINGKVLGTGNFSRSTIVPHLGAGIRILTLSTAKGVSTKKFSIINHQ